MTDNYHIYIARSTDLKWHEHQFVNRQGVGVILTTLEEADALCRRLLAVFYGDQDRGWFLYDYDKDESASLRMSRYCTMPPTSSMDNRIIAIVANNPRTIRTMQLNDSPRLIIETFPEAVPPPKLSRTDQDILSLE